MKTISKKLYLILTNYKHNYFQTHQHSTCLKFKREHELFILVWFSLSGRAGGRMDRRTDGRKDDGGRTDRRTNDRTNGRADKKTDPLGVLSGWTYTDDRTEGWREGREGIISYRALSRNGDKQTTYGGNIAAPYLLVVTSRRASSDLYLISWKNSILLAKSRPVGLWIMANLRCETPGGRWYIRRWRVVVRYFTFI